MQGEKKQRGQGMSMNRPICHFGERTGRALFLKKLSITYMGYFPGIP